MAWTTPRTWVTGELMTSGTLNTHLRDNQRYLHGDDGAITLLSRLNVPELYIDGLKVDPALIPGLAPVVTPASALFGTLPVGPIAERVLIEAKFATPDQRYLVLGKAAVEAVDADDLGHKADIWLGYVSGSSPTEVVMDTTSYTIPSGAAAPNQNRAEVWLFGYATVPSDAVLPFFRLAGHKSGGTGGTLGYGVSLRAFPF